MMNQAAFIQGGLFPVTRSPPPQRSTPTTQFVPSRSHQVHESAMAFIRCDGAPHEIISGQIKDDDSSSF